MTRDPGPEFADRVLQQLDAEGEASVPVLRPRMRRWPLVAAAVFVASGLSALWFLPHADDTESRQPDLVRQIGAPVDEELGGYEALLLREWDAITADLRVAIARQGACLPR